jgi:hypothetical protein
MYGTAYSYQILMTAEFSRQTFEKSSDTKLHENPSRGSLVSPCGWTDKRTDTTKLIANFRNFANELINKNIF